MAKKNVIDVRRTLRRAFRDHTEDYPDEIDMVGRKRVRMCYREPWGTTDRERLDCHERTLASVVRFLRQCRDASGCDREWTREFVEGEED